MDWLLLVTWVPVSALVITLKTGRILQSGKSPDLWLWLDLLKSDFFWLGFLFFFLFAVFHSGHRLLFFLFFSLVQFLLIFSALLEITGHHYHLATGSYITWELLSYALTRLDQLSSVMASESSILSTILLFGFPVLLLLLPWGLYWLLKDHHRDLGNLFIRPRIFSLVLALAMLGALFIPPLREKDSLFAGNFSANALTTGVASLRKERERRDEWQNNHGALLQSETRGHHNLVLVILESTGHAATDFGGLHKTTPHLSRLAGGSLTAERMRAVVPHTSKSLVAIHCGMEPDVAMPINEAARDGIPGKCLPQLLEEAGYSTVFFQSPWKWFENRSGLIRNFGYAEFYPGESFSTEGFSEINYFGYEDDIMLKPGLDWISRHRAKNPHRPFFAAFLTGGSHHYYGLPAGYRRKKFVSAEKKDRYLNTVAATDAFLGRLFRGFESLGLMKDTVFVIVGDHGEAFGEHQITGHSFVPYEEVMHVPFVMKAPGRFRRGFRLSHPVSQMDILPSISEALGFRIRNNHYRGVSFFTPDRNRRFHGACWHENECLVQYSEESKTIHYFGKRPDEIFDLRNDPGESSNLAADEPAREIRVRDALRWYGNAAYFYESHRSSRINP